MGVVCKVTFIQLIPTLLRLLKLHLLDGLGWLTASMTSTPALAMLVDLAGTDAAAAPYATTYPIALITLIITMQILVNM